jgi:hypothetical protein
MPSKKIMDKCLETEKPYPSGFIPPENMASSLFFFRK